MDVQLKRKERLSGSLPYHGFSQLKLNTLPHVSRPRPSLGHGVTLIAGLGRQKPCPWGKQRSVPQRSAILACRTPRRFWSKHLIWTLFRTKHPWTEKGPEFNEEKNVPHRRFSPEKISQALSFRLTLLQRPRSFLNSFFRRCQRFGRRSRERRRREICKKSHVGDG